MKRSGLADLPLHWGKTPKWLFERIAKQAKNICEVIILEYGRDEFLKRISDPFWFQAFSCILGWDFHSSGSTTTTCGALKAAINPEEHGIAILGGKGRTSRKTPDEIEQLADIFPLTTKTINKLKYSSKMSAKIDNALLQDYFTLYHHTFIVTEDGKWGTIQQGMRSDIGYARRYHWISEKVKSFVVEPHIAICCDIKGDVLNLVASESEDVRKCSVDIVKENPKRLEKYLLMQKEHTFGLKRYKPLLTVHELNPKNYEELVAIKGIGPRSIRALALISDLVYNIKASHKDPVKYSFAVGGKDGIPYPIDRKTYDKSIEILRTAVEHAKLGRKDKLNALKKLKDFENI
ncbi:MAG: DUF763 domain-containing protein [Methanosarcinales archaeon]